MRARHLDDDILDCIASIVGNMQSSITAIYEIANTDLPDEAFLSGLGFQQRQQCHAIKMPPKSTARLRVSVITSILALPDASSCVYP